MRSLKRLQATAASIQVIRWSLDVKGCGAEPSGQKTGGDSTRMKLRRQMLIVDCTVASLGRTSVSTQHSEDGTYMIKRMYY